ncbi:hypothetical protein FGIG_10390 [Fasciola gigantica]|uniref:Uncharacterized protein n=1 Tax=Fasciola gigantica TaxID=46835 RepID=A0A504Z971_FASGI|nr:hypothetical protein FGIG_10390 [Fasciola gigantica]
MDEIENNESGENSNEAYAEDDSGQPPSYESTANEETTFEETTEDGSAPENDPPAIEEVAENNDTDEFGDDKRSYHISDDDPKSWALDSAMPADQKERSFRRRITEIEMEGSLEVHLPADTKMHSKQPCNTEGDNLKKPLLPTSKLQAVRTKQREPERDFDGPHHHFEGPRQPIRPVDQFQWPRGGTMLVTTYKEDYPARVVNEREIPIKPKPSLSMPKQDEPSYTSYRKEFLPLPIERTESCRPKQSYVPPEEPMQGTTSYQLEFPPREAQKRESLKPSQNLEHSSEPMEQRTSYMLDFPPRGSVSREEQYRPTCQPNFLSGLSTGISAYREEFTTPILNPFHRWRPEYIYSPPRQPMESQSVYRSAFGPISPDPTESFAPKRVYVPPTEAISNVTSYRVDFQAPPLVKPATFKPYFTYQRSENKMSSFTTYNRDYLPISGDRVQPFLPKPQLSLPEENYPSISSYTWDFPRKQGLNTGKFTPKTNLQLPTDPFLGESIYKTHFLEYSPVAVQLFNPAQTFSPPSIRMDDKTTYRLSYLPILHRAARENHSDRIPHLASSFLSDQMQTSGITKTDPKHGLKLTDFLIPKPTRLPFISDCSSPGMENSDPREDVKRTSKFSLLKPLADHRKEMLYPPSFMGNDQNNTGSFDNWKNRAKQFMGPYNMFNDLAGDQQSTGKQVPTEWTERKYEETNLRWDPPAKAYSNRQNLSSFTRVARPTQKLPSMRTKSQSVAMKKVKKVLNSEPVIGLRRSTRQ